MLRPELMHRAHSPEITATAPPVVGLSVKLAGVGSTSNTVPDLFDLRLYAAYRTRRLASSADKPHFIDESLSFSSIAF